MTREPRLKLLKPSISDGPREGMEFETGAMYDVDEKPCPACKEPIDKGAEIIKHDYRWVHAHCLSDHLLTLASSAGWLVIAAQLARYPRRFSVPETRVVVNALIRVAGGLPVAPWTDDDLN